jgi:protein-S-isoprenylcysteine O-methyltransferase Ste14
MRDLWLALRSVFWFLVLPGISVGYIPWILGLGDAQPDLRHPADVIAVVLIVAGALVLLACAWEFAHSGRGTLSPVDAPRALVVQGLYRYVRNPMYVGGVIILAGDVLLVRSAGLLLYAVIWFAAVNAFVILYEERALRRRFGASYENYTHRVHRWVPRPPGDTP